IRQGPGKVLYSFAIDGKLLPAFTTISRIGRANGNHVHGYQRPEVLSHIAEIRNYLESGSPMIPNAIVIAFDDRVRFQASRGADCLPDSSRPGVITIPIDPSLPDAEKPGWVVDGQQRIAAIREANLEYFPICAIGFVAHSDKEQREQFILVNST